MTTPDPGPYHRILDPEVDGPKLPTDELKQFLQADNHREYRVKTLGLGLRKAADKWGVPASAISHCEQGQEQGKKDMKVLHAKLAPYVQKLATELEAVKAERSELREVLHTITESARKAIMSQSAAGQLPSEWLDPLHELFDAIEDATRKHGTYPPEPYGPELHRGGLAAELERQRILADNRKDAWKAEQKLRQETQAELASLRAAAQPIADTADSLFAYDSVRVDWPMWFGPSYEQVKEMQRVLNDKQLLEEEDMAELITEEPKPEPLTFWRPPGGVWVAGFWREWAPLTEEFLVISVDRDDPRAQALLTALEAVDAHIAKSNDVRSAILADLRALNESEVE